jgi:hypothetical protein
LEVSNDDTTAKIPRFGPRRLRDVESVEEEILGLADVVVSDLLWRHVGGRVLLLQQRDPLATVVGPFECVGGGGVEGVRVRIA